MSNLKNPAYSFVKREFYIDKTPCVIYNEGLKKCFLTVHGQGGNKEEAERFSRVAVKYGYGVLSLDLPMHGGRRDGVEFLTWAAVPEIKKVYAYAAENYETVALRATSIGAYFSLIALYGETVERCLLSSPLIDMRAMISSLMAAANVDTKRLEKEKIIPTPFGQTLNYDYYLFANKTPVLSVSDKTFILYASGDEVIPRNTVETFAQKNGAKLTVLDGFRHYLHSPEEIKYVEKWENESIAF